MSIRTLKIARPEAASMDNEALENAFRVLAKEVESGALPGAVAAVGRRGSIVGFRSYGWAQMTGGRRLMQMDTVFDLASLTKVVATLPATLRLMDAGAVRLDDPVTKFVPKWTVAGADKVRLRHLLCHQAGLGAHPPLADAPNSSDEIRSVLLKTEVVTEPGTKVEYSDTGFLLLQMVIEQVTGMDIAGYCQKHIFSPLGMKDTGFAPAAEQKQRAAATEYNRELDKVLVGEVHDDTARLLGGVAGHAGLFSTAHDLCVYCQMILNHGVYSGARILSGAGIDASFRNYSKPPQESRGLGWAKKDDELSSSGDYLSGDVVYHTGFTGTSIHISPLRELFIVLLTNRVHPSRENEAIHHVRPRFCNAVAAAIDDWE